MEEIGIQQVLAEINTTPTDGSSPVFAIGWIRQNAGRGGKRGTLKRVERCVRKIGSKRSAKGAEPRKRADVKRGKLLVLYDLDTHHRVDCSIHTIIEYNGQRVRH